MNIKKSLKQEMHYIWGNMLLKQADSNCTLMKKLLFWLWMCIVQGPFRMLKRPILLQLAKRKLKKLGKNHYSIHDFFDTYLQTNQIASKKRFNKQTICTPLYLIVSRVKWKRTGKLFFFSMCIEFSIFYCQTRIQVKSKSIAKRKLLK